jgi:hypothetical protein
VIAPSAFILDIALLCSPGIRATIIPPGVRVGPGGEVPGTPPDFAAQAPRHVVGVVGAVGPHKGSGVLEALAAALVGSEIGIVVIGYTDTHLTRGWLVPGALYVHGAYQDGSLNGWLAAYRVETVLFPNRLPESFSYTLSEVWAAGLPVVVPDQGALGERVGRYGGGWLLPAGFDSDDAAALLVWLAAAEGAAERTRVKSRIAPGDALRVPTLDAMSRDTDALYEHFGLAPADAPDDARAVEALAPLLAANLDGFAFRKELVNLAGEVERARAHLAEAQRWNEELQRNSTAWATKLEADIAALKQEVDRLFAETQDLARYKAFWDRFPKFIRTYLFERDSRARR